MALIPPVSGIMSTRPTPQLPAAASTRRMMLTRSAVWRLFAFATTRRMSRADTGLAMRPMVGGGAAMGTPSGALLPPTAVAGSLAAESITSERDCAGNEPAARRGALADVVVPLAGWFEVDHPATRRSRQRHDSAREDWT